MQVQEDPSRLVLQPETEGEQSALNMLQALIKDLDDAPAAYFTLDVADYADLDHDLASRAVFAPDRSRYDAGARALVVTIGRGV
ncbi:hypothetical protein [Halobaculum magnesiiphilum]|uniref:Uncharacterized protein n=1 Tax=Halobaculum magnesiiphilum TaxID=1017351 RepID=A0A8T8WD15_9EURY|nr:hypothetical protein [Halobaculum magnesiiphilum]QZP37762.1 hypothetical protein K6T50_00850 [Halobaculum magnesiiphilum]